MLHFGARIPKRLCEINERIYDLCSGRWLYAASNRYDDFIRCHEELYILFLELGVEANMPVIIKYPSRYEGKVRSIIELDNKTIRSQNLLDAMTAYGEYSKIPEPEKSSHIEVAYFEPNPYTPI